MYTVRLTNFNTTKGPFPTPHEAIKELVRCGFEGVVYEGNNVALIAWSPISGMTYYNHPVVTLNS